jgi:light-regulated signal transduction histidine kinase (bacteriophytochrome)
LEENARLYKEILALNESLEERVQDRTAQLREANEQLHGFTYSIAHDFRQYIRNINVNAQLVLADAGEEIVEIRSFLENISLNARLMSQMTDDLLTYARMRDMVVRPVEIDLTALATEISQICTVTYPRAKYKVAQGLSVYGDPTMFRIVFQNLLDNAFKYSQHAEDPLVEVGRDRDGFFVRDNGIGLDIAYAHKLFMPFERLRSETEFAGTGMGLANVRRILERHNGKVWVESTEGKGATFRFSMGDSEEPRAPLGSGTAMDC